MTEAEESDAHAEQLRRAADFSATWVAWCRFEAWTRWAAWKLRSG